MTTDRTAIAVVADLLDRIDDNNADGSQWCRLALQLLAECDLSAPINEHIVTNQHNKTLPMHALAAALLVQRIADRATTPLRRAELILAESYLLTCAIWLADEVTA
jgi:hypothetical protein